MNILFDFERQRLIVQAALDAEKTSLQRNKLGQFATPTELATDILCYAKALHGGGGGVDFLDPALGTGSFYSALKRVFDESEVNSARGFEIDPHYALPAMELWGGDRLEINLADFTTYESVTKSNLVICNPPYVRHHHMDAAEKKRLKDLCFNVANMKLSGLAGLYCYFMGVAHGWMSEGGIAGWLIPSEFMDVNYGKKVKEYLLDEVTLLHIHRFDPADVQFSDALVSSAVVWFKKAAPNDQSDVEFSFGGTLNSPRVTRFVSREDLRAESKWSRFPVSDVREASSGAVISDYFKIRRGLATGGNDFFILSEDEVKSESLRADYLRPVLPSARYIDQNVIESDEFGIPKLEKKLFLLDARESEAEVSARWPELSRYLEKGIQEGVSQGYLCKNRPVWFWQEQRLPPPIVCTYMGRSSEAGGNPFRFILNRSKATITNSFLGMYPVGDLAKAILLDESILHTAWEELNLLSPDSLLGEGRVYGGGLHKLEPKELANVQVHKLKKAIDLVLSRPVT
jgi:predicted RNA methylase